MLCPAADCLPRSTDEDTSFHCKVAGFETRALEGMLAGLHSQPVRLYR